MAGAGRAASTLASYGATEATKGRCRGRHTTAATKGGRYGNEGSGWGSGQGASSCRRGARAPGCHAGGHKGATGAPPRDVATQGRSTSALGVATRGAAPTGPASSALLWCRGAPTRAHGPRRSARTEGCSGGGGATTSVATEGPAATYRSAALTVPWSPTAAPARSARSTPCAQATPPPPRFSPSGRATCDFPRGTARAATPATATARCAATSTAPEAKAAQSPSA